MSGSTLTPMILPVDLQEIYRAVYERFRKASNWVQFYREVFGIKGLLRQAFPLPQQLLEFQKTHEYVEIQRMLAYLRKQPIPINHEEETKVITLRIPKSLYQAIRREASEYDSSMNKYCISKLLQLLDARVFSLEDAASEEEKKSLQPTTSPSESAQGA